jgi:hypothetical protein
MAAEVLYAMLGRDRAVRASMAQNNGLEDLLELTEVCVMVRVGHNHTVLGIYGVHTVFLAGKSPYIRSYTVQIGIRFWPTLFMVNYSYANIYAQSTAQIDIWKVCLSLLYLFWIYVATLTTILFPKHDWFHPRTSLH